VRVSQAAARIYADALFDIGAEESSLERIGRELHAVRDAFAQLDPELRGFFEMPQLPRDGKWQVLDEAFGNTLDRAVQGLLHVLVERRREVLLDAIIEEYDHLLDEHGGRVQAVVVTARPLDTALTDALRSAIERNTRRQVVLHERVDPNVLGGIRVRIGDVVVDGTVRRSLADMRQALTSSLA